MGKRLMIVAGGEWQVPLVQTAKRLGHYVINTNLYPDSPGFRYADVGLVADVVDRELNLRLAREHRPDGVVTDQSDIAVPTVAFVCEKLGLTGIGVEKAKLFTNKAAMRDFCRTHGYATPDYRLCHAVDECREFYASTNGNVVIKPPDNQSSRGVTRVTQVSGLPEAWEAAREQTRGDTVLVESFVDGTEVAVDGLKLPGRHMSLAACYKTHTAHNPMIANRLIYDTSYADIDWVKLKRQNDRLVEEMALPFGLTHAEYLCADGDFYLVEVAARGGGTKISSHIVPIVSGVESNSLLIAMSFGEIVDAPVPLETGQCVMLSFFELRHGLVKAVAGLDEIRELPGVVDAGLTFDPGDVLRPAADDRSRHGHLIVTGQNREELEVVRDKACRLLRVDYE